MATGNLPACLALTLPHEGGWSDHPKDPGGATMKGITLATYRRWKPGASKQQLRNISNSEVEMIYRDGYWKPVNGDRLPAGVDAATFDYAVNSGVGRASRELQTVVGMNAIDGVIGPATANRVAELDGKTTIQKLCARRLSFMQSLKIWSTFRRGWSRRVADVEARSVKMWLQRAGTSAAFIAPLMAEAKKADRTADTQKTSAKTTAGGGVTAGGADTVANGDFNWLLLGGLAGVVIIAAVILAVHVMKNRERAIAYREAAES